MFARVGWTSDLLGQWINIQLKINDSGYWEFTSNKAEDVNFCKTAIQDEYESKEIPFEIPYYGIFGNMYGLSPDLEIDLSQTGFKKDGEWVWRPVKEIQ